MVALKTDIISLLYKEELFLLNEQLSMKRLKKSVKVYV